MRARLRCVVIAMAGLAQAAPPLALAALGGDVASVQADGAHMKASVRPGVAVAGYTVQQMTIASGTVVREYVSPAGKVFAVSWHGPTMPDLRQTLGTYFEQYTAGASAPHVGHRHLTVRQPDLVVQSNGRPRGFYGRAYVPSLLPANVSIDDIQ
ncbi:MAG TPA: DUF2844 domain-containing protein [Steroidobacteraceae bacterium]|nr:DUF2844 domain-containing protein [Steroidobacteraceae bacterium]